MMKIYRLAELTGPQTSGLCERNPVSDETVLSVCTEVFRSVRERGDEAVRDYTRRFDGVSLDSLRVPREKIAGARGHVKPDVLRALTRAAGNIRKFHASQQRQESSVTVSPGVRCWRESRPIRRVGLYVPGGSAPLPSTALMLAIPARLAGCREILICSPPMKNGEISPVILLAAELAGVEHIYRVGGAQAVAAMTLGTESIPRVDKIFGPGNRYVTTAKYLAVEHGVSIDALAGPSEVLVIADDSADPAAVASDLISQAEHDRDSRAVLVSTSSELIDRVGEEVDRQLESLPRQEFARPALENSYLLQAESLEDAFEFSNLFAPEHLILQIREAGRWVPRVESAGSVFVGPWSPEVAGDYASGTNHVLPTSGTARSASGVSLDSFVKRITFQELTRTGLESLSATLETFARTESLEGHARAITVRMASAGGPTSREFQLEDLVRPNIRNLRPYRSARDTIQKGILLDANENPFAQEVEGIELNRYPDPHQKKLRQVLAGHLGVSSSQVLCGAGSDEVLDWLLKVFCQPGRDRVAITPPTYGMYRVVADIQGVETFEFPLNGNFDFEAETFLQTVPSDVKILILCSPNNPTANLLSEGEILKVCEDWAGLVVLDEAYVEFSSRESMAKRVERSSNLVVLRTFSKAQGRAGIRLGYAVAAPGIISYFQKVKMPYNLNVWTMEEGCRVLRNSEERARQLSEILRERARVTSRLRSIPGVQHVFPSQANFLLFRCDSATEVYRRLLERDIVIRDRSTVNGLEGCLRLTIGTERENNCFLDEISVILEDIRK